MNLYRAYFVPGGADPHGLLLEEFPINVPRRPPITSDPSTWPKPRTKFCYWKSVLKYSKRCGKVATFWVIVLHCEEANAPGPPKNPPVNPPTSPPILDCKDMNPDWPTCPDNMYFTAKEACRDCNSHFEGVFSPSKKPQIVDSPKFAPPPAISVHISCFDQVGDQGDSVICGSCCSDDKFSLVTRGCFCAPSNQ